MHLTSSDQSKTDLAKERTRLLQTRAESISCEGTYRDAETAAKLLLNDFHSRVISTDQFEDALNRIQSEIDNPITSGEWTSIRPGVLHWRWQGMGYGVIVDTRKTDGRGPNVLDPWQTSDSSRHQNIKDAKKHEIANHVSFRLKEDGFIKDLQQQVLKQEANELILDTSLRSRRFR